MKRRTFVRHAGLAGILATATPPAFAQAQAGEVRWRCTSSFPKSLDTIYGGAEVIAKRVAALTGNKFRIQVFAAGEIVPGLQALDADEQRRRSSAATRCPTTSSARTPRSASARACRSASTRASSSRGCTTAAGCS